MTPTKVNIENENKPITLSWENIDIYTPSSHEGFTGKIKKNVCFFKKETKDIRSHSILINNTPFINKQSS